MKKFKMFLAVLTIATSANFAFAMEKNNKEKKEFQLEEQIEKEIKQEEKKDSLNEEKNFLRNKKEKDEKTTLEQIKKKADIILKKTNFEKVINLYKEAGIFNEFDKNFETFNNKKNLVRKKNFINVYLKILEEKLKSFLETYINNVKDFDQVEFKGFKSLITNKNNEKIVLKNSETITIDLDGNIDVEFDFTPDEEQTKNLKKLLLKEQEENEKIKKYLENNNEWIFYEKNDN